MPKNPKTDSGGIGPFNIPFVEAPDLPGAAVYIREEEEDLEKTSKRQDIGERKRYALLLYLLTVGWLVYVAVVIMLEGLGAWKFSLPVPVLLALITTTTINIIGLLLVVTRYLFYRPIFRLPSSRM